MDELLWAATWLYKATDNKMYFEYVLSNAHSFGGTGWSISEFSWDVKYAGLQLMLSKVKTFPHSSLHFLPCDFYFYVNPTLSRFCFSNLKNQNHGVCTNQGILISILKT